ncbi:unnamed protein product [Ambrosiozyma monospora]|uniref:Unnamed protein product n=1 Tax=Ambrosiozyma monospora TaxID=43982 RepID=A0ACB5T3U0_AMBMO|nr:unnamed protein product [Ambrosiozyma monospora]
MFALKDLVDTLREQSLQNNKNHEIEWEFAEETVPFDEAAFDKMQSDLLSFLVTENFPATMEKEDLVIELVATQVEKLNGGKFQDFLKILDANLGEEYLRIEGKKWKSHKLKEMKEEGLVYIELINQHSSETIGFLSMKLVFDNEVLCVYLYEIQLLKEYTGLKIGSELMRHFHKLPGLINIGLEANEDRPLDDEDDDMDDADKSEITDLRNEKEKERIDFLKNYGKVEGCSLTVFTKNERALKFYQGLGYIKADHSPRDKKLRNVRVVKPDYYIMFNYL